MDPLPLAQDFPPPDPAAWVALVEKTLKGPGPDSLTSTSPDGISTRALYVQATAQPDAVRFGAVRSQGPGRWDARTVVAHPEPREANRQVLQDLENGANSILLRIASHGRDGVAIGGTQDMASVLAGVELELAPVALDAGFLGLAAARQLDATARSAPRAKLAFHLDPIGAFAAAGESPGPISAHLQAAASFVAERRDAYPDMTGFLASGQVAHEAGATQAQELALMLASALAYLKAMDEAGVGPPQAAPLIVLGLAAEAEYFVTLAKHRAARALWVRLLGALGTAAPARIEARSSRRMLSRLDPWVNLLRLTAAGFGAAVGGADALVIEPFTQPLGPPTDFARRQARNAQLVLMEESGLARVEDPAGGCWFLEDQTDQLARAAWSLFQQIEAAGGVLAALEAGMVAGWAAKGRETLAAEVASGARKLVGVNIYRAAEGADVGVDESALNSSGSAARMDARLPGEDGRCPPLEPWRLAQPVEAETAA